MALPFLPGKEIPRMFEQLEEYVEQAPLTDLLQYIREQWIEALVFPPRNWSVYQQAVRTDNDIEGWHNALNRHAAGRSNICMYQLIEEIDRDAQLAAISMRLVSKRKLKRLEKRVWEAT